MKVLKLIHYTRLFPTLQALKAEWGDGYPDIPHGSLALLLEGPYKFPVFDDPNEIVEGVKVATPIGLGWAYYSAYEEVELKD